MPPCPPEQERVITAATLQQKLEAVQASEAELQAQVSTMQETVLRLCTMEEQLACLRSTHNHTLEEVERLTASNTVRPGALTGGRGCSGEPYLQFANSVFLLTRYQADQNNTET